MTLTRRDALALSAAFAAFGPARAQSAEPGMTLGPASPWSAQSLLDRARAMAQSDYAPMADIPQPWQELTYDQYRSIWFDSRNALWRDTDRPARVEFFAPGLYFPRPIAVNVVEGGQSRPATFDPAVFDRTDMFPDLPVDDTLGYSGFRILGEIETPGIQSEYAVFQGASYFRAIGRGQTYGLSARGLALNTAAPEGEEFPDFREFWIEAPAPGSSQVTVHALLDGPSVTGIYHFTLAHGVSTVMQVSATIFARAELSNVGLAAETSMFFFDETNRSRFDDFRPAVHDSDGLLIANGAGEVLWRPLANPRELQISSFVDTNPKGFGLMQRARHLGDFADLEAHYHDRPGLWVTPGEDWGKGAVTLVEIPTDREIYDNIVSYWRPRDVIPKGGEHSFSYRLDWCAEAPVPHDRAQVINTRMGARRAGGHIVTVDFADHERLPDDLSKITLHVSGNRGTVSPGILQRNPATGGVRLAFSFDPGERRSVELRAQLMLDSKAISEVWLYRWTA
ncbi:OpgD/OpgG family glucan biosynthesis protein [Halovulum sp. GXIMD14793]